jgi:hypothetical protein
MPVNYELFKRLRTGVHPLLPRTASSVMHEYRRINSGKAASYEEEKRGWNLDFRWSDRAGQYGGYRSTVTLHPLTVQGRGFDPAHLTITANAAVSDWHLSVEDTVENMGFAVERASRWDALAGRPSHEAVRVEFGERNPKWVQVSEREARYFCEGVAWKGMSRGVRAQVRHEVLLAAARDTAAYVSDVCADRIHQFDVSVVVRWRGEVIGVASVGGCECKGDTDALTDFIFDNGLVDEAFVEAFRWADDAVADAQRRAAKIVNDIALLPERSIEAVRGQFRTATVTDIRKEA